MWVIQGIFVGITQDDIEAKRHKKEADMLRDLQLFIDGNVGRQPHSSGSMRRRRDGAKPEYRDVWDKFMTSSKTPNSLMMHVAAANGYLEVMDLLLKYRFPVDLEDADGWLPIHASVAWNQVRMYHGLSLYFGRAVGFLCILVRKLLSFLWFPSKMFDKNSLGPHMKDEAVASVMRW